MNQGPIAEDTDEDDEEAKEIGSGVRRGQVEAERNKQRADDTARASIGVDELRYPHRNGDGEGNGQ